MKILIVSQYYNPDPFRLHEAAEGLAAEGHEITVLTGTPNYVSKESILSSKVITKSGRENGVDIIRVPTFRRRGGKISLGISYVSYVATASLRALLLKKEYDVILVYQLSPILMIIPAWIASKIQKKRIALYCLDLWPESIVGSGITHESKLYNIMRSFSIRAYDSVDFLGYTSRQFEKYFKYDLKLKQKHYAYIPQFAEDIYSSIERVSHDGINYLFAGNIGEAQSVETIVKAAAYTTNPNIKWHIVGDGSSYHKCKKLAEDLNVTNKVIFYGRKPIEEMPHYYSIADALIVTLANNKIISYTLPGKVQSYMASGIPIIAAASGETQDIIEEANCGLCCASEDPKELAKVADCMVASNRQEMGKNAKEYYQRYFTKKQYIEALESLLYRTIQE